MGEALAAVAAAPGQRPQPRHDLVDRERLDDVVVGAGFEARAPGPRPRRARSASARRRSSPSRAAAGRRRSRSAPASPRRARRGRAPSPRPAPARRRRRRRAETSKPSAPRLRSSIRRTAASSSTIRTRSAIAAVSPRRRRGAGRRARRRSAPGPRRARRPRAPGSTGVPVDRRAQEALPGVELGAEQVGMDRRRGPGRIPISWTSSENIRVPTIAAALLRKTVEKKQADAGDREDRDQVDEQAGADQPEPFAGRDLGCRRGW